MMIFNAQINYSCHASSNVYRAQLFSAIKHDWRGLKYSCSVFTRKLRKCIIGWQWLLWMMISPQISYRTNKQVAITQETWFALETCWYLFAGSSVSYSTPSPQPAPQKKKKEHVLIQWIRAYQVHKLIFHWASYRKLGILQMFVS